MGLVGRILGRHGTGYLPDGFDHRDRSLDTLGLSSQAPPASVSLRTDGIAPFDQGATNSCVAQAIVQAVRVRRAYLSPLSSTVPEPLSRLHLYSNARAYHGATRRDDGTHIRLAIKALGKFGAPPESVWPFAQSKVNARPPLNSYREAHQFRSLSYYRIADSGLRKLDAIKAALAAGHPVVAGWLIDADFMRNGGAARFDAIRGRVIGGHAMLIDGYDGDDFHVLNSWGARWRDGGSAVFSGDLVLQGIDTWALDC